MKRSVGLPAILLFGLGVPACGGDTPATPSPESSATFTFTANLLPANEIPAVIGSEATGSAAAAVRLDVTRSHSGAIVAAAFDIAAAATGFPAGTSLTAAHLHAGASGVNGVTIADLGLAPGEVAFPTGEGAFGRAAIALTPDQANAILANPAGFYVDICTANNPNGVARGQLVRLQ